MKTVLVVVALLLGTTYASSYLKEGCIVVEELTTTVYGNSLQFSLLFPLESGIEVFLPTQNVTFQIEPKNVTQRGWLQVELFFYKKLELKDRDGNVILLGNTTGDVEVKPPPQEIVLKSPNILRNCPEGEPVWRIDKSREFPLKERNLFAIILQHYPMSFELTINQQVWNLTCDNSRSCSFNRTSLDSPMMSIIRSPDGFKVWIDDVYFGYTPFGKNFVRFSLIKSRPFFIAQPKEQEEPETAEDNADIKLLLTGLIFLAICFLVSFGFNAYYVYLQKEICGLCGSKQTEDHLYANTGNETKQTPAIQCKGNASSVQPNPRYLPVEPASNVQPNPRYLPVEPASNVQPNPRYLPVKPYMPSRKTQNVDNSVQEVSSACKSRNTESSAGDYSSCAQEGDYSNPNAVSAGDYSSCAQEDDYINPNEVKPHEVEIMIKENLIKGRVFPSEALQDVKHVKPGDYISLTELEQNITNIKDDEEPDYMNITKRM